jgi:mono/diheme cytochrome c family protein
MIHYIKPLLLCTLAAFSFAKAQSQPRKFPSPASADTIKNQIKSDPASVVSGKKIYAQYCVTCHGEKGKGDGIAAPGLPKPPADHTSGFVQSQTDGALFWIITMGNTPMPSYKTSLTATQRWQVINYIRTLAKTSKK